MGAKKVASREKPINIPLSFEEAIGGLLAVKPQPKSSAKRKPVRKK